ncbi:Ig-like domain-containing protein [Exiguobacterium sp. NG55]|uniref:Ig-like domain-containing protein n=1 Tax=Exiguobacterium sp. NG55 TaxID=375477 RepID=UPI0004DF37A6|nr:Ig-like domain-containing protein [Exiguobacterium sp. NG55]
MKRSMYKLISSLVVMFVMISTVVHVNAAESRYTLPMQGQVNGEIIKGDEEQIYELELTEAGRITIDLNSSIDSYGKFQFRDSQNNSIFQTYIEGDSKNPGRAVYVRDLEKGTYRLTVSNDNTGGALGKYFIKTTFKVAATDDVEPNNGTAEAQKLTFGKKTRGYLSTQDTVDVYGVQLTKAGALTVDLSSYVDGYTMIQLVDEYNTQVYRTYIEGTSKNPVKFFRNVNLEPGQYYLRVYDESSNDDTGVYEVKATFVSAMNTEVEPNNGTVEAKAIPFYKTQTGFLSWNDQIDVYKISIPKTSKVGIDMTSYVEDYATVTLLDANNNKLMGQYVYGSTKMPGRYKEFITLKRGTYYLSVRDDYGTDDTGKYKLKVTSTHLLPALSVNKVTARSTKVSGKTEKGATVTMTIGKKSYKRTADAKGNYSFSISKQKAGTSIKISSKNKYGSSVKTIKVSK